MIRAVGPGLSGFGVRNAPSVRLQVFDNAAKLLAENSAWVATDISPTADRVEALLRWMVERLAPDERGAARRGRGRARVLPALCLWGGLMVCVLRGFASLPIRVT